MEPEVAEEQQQLSVGGCSIFLFVQGSSMSGEQGRSSDGDMGSYT